MGLITPFGWQHSVGPDPAGGKELSRSFEPCLSWQGSIWTNLLWQFEPSHRVMLSEAKDLAHPAPRCFASLSMTALDLAVAEELSRAYEPCLNLIIGDGHGEPAPTTWPDYFVNLHHLLISSPPSKTHYIFIATTPK